MLKDYNAIKKIVMALSEGSTCPKARVGAVLLKDGRIIASGYNGSLPKKAHCDDKGCIEIDNHCISTIHAEANCVAYCAKHGISAQGCQIVVSHSPCRVCTKLLIMAGITEILFLKPYKESENPFRDDIHWEQI